MTKDEERASRRANRKLQTYRSKYSRLEQEGAGLLRRSDGRFDQRHSKARTINRAMEELEKEISDAERDANWLASPHTRRLNHYLFWHSWRSGARLSVVTLVLVLALCILFPAKWDWLEHFSKWISQNSILKPPVEDVMMYGDAGIAAVLGLATLWPAKILAESRIRGRVAEALGIAPEIPDDKEIVQQPILADDE